MSVVSIKNYKMQVSFKIEQMQGRQSYFREGVCVGGAQSGEVLIMWRVCLLSTHRYSFWMCIVLNQPLLFFTLYSLSYSVNPRCPSLNSIM